MDVMLAELRNAFPYIYSFPARRSAKPLLLATRVRAASMFVPFPVALEEASLVPA
jgi:hypothetical protein